MNTPASPFATDAPIAHPAPRPAPGSRPSATHGVLFDIGYTLLDETARLRAAIHWLAEQRAGAGAPFDELHARYLETCAAPDPGSPSLFVQMMLSMGATLEQARELRRRMQWDAVALTPYPDALPALRRLRKVGLRLGVLANQPASAHEDLRRADLLPLLDDVWLSEAVGLAKPDPAFFQLAIDAWNLPPRNIAYVGDRPDNDVQPAKALGLHTVLLKVGPHARQQPRNAPQSPDFTARNLLEAAEHLARWSSAPDR